MDDAEGGSEANGNRSGSAKLNSGISGNSGHSAGLMTVWQAGVRDEISEEADSGAQTAS